MTDDVLDDAPPVRLDVPVCRAIADHPELRAAEDDSTSPGTLIGEFSLFNEWYEIHSWWEGDFIERLVPGSFKRTINNRSGETPVRVLLEHGFDPTVGDKPLGVPDILEERETGPYAETPLFDTSYNRDLAPAVRAGAYGQSFRFQVLRDEWVEEPEVSDYNPKGLPERTITEVRLIEFGTTVFPASPGTNDTTGLRSTSTTDSFYERLNRRDPSRYDAALQSVRSTRAPEKPKPAPADQARTTEDPQDEHSPDSADTDATRADDDHSPDSPAPHSTDPSTPKANTATPKRKNTNMDENETMTVEERNARISECRARMTDLDSEFAGAVMPEEARTEFDQLDEEIGRHEQAIADQEERRARISARAAEETSTEVAGGGAGNVKAPGVSRNGSRGGSTPGASSASIYDMGALRQRARSLDDMRGLMHENARRAIAEARYPGAEDADAARSQVDRLLDKVDDDEGTLARRILVTGSPTYERAFGKALASGGQLGGLTAEEQRALSLGTNSEGGYAVPFQLDPTVMLTNDGVADPIRQIARVEQIVGKEWQGLTTAGITATRRAEKAESTDNAPAFGQPTCKVSRVDAFVPFTVELEQDWSSLKSELTTLLADAKATEEADSFVNGDGTANASGVEPEGILTGATTLVQTATANAFASGDLYDLEEALGPRFRKNASWFAERSFYNAARQLGSDSDGGDLWVRLAQGLPPELIGYPTYEGSEMPTFALADDTKVAILGDFKKFLIVDRVGMNIELVPHLLGANRRPTGMRGIWAFWRNGSKVLIPGAFRVLKINPGA